MFSYVLSCVHALILLLLLKCLSIAFITFYFFDIFHILNLTTTVSQSVTIATKPNGNWDRGDDPIEPMQVAVDKKA
jgi:hypothetical protein